MNRLFIALLLLSPIVLFAANDTIKIDVKTLGYSSAFERSQFLKMESGNGFNALDLLISLDSTVDEAKAKAIKKRLDTFVNEKVENYAQSKNKEKAVKAIFKEIHEGMLKKYTLQSRFEKLLDAGEYNCVTATALYSLIFTKLGIDYQIRSTTNHVYVIALPGPDEIMIETTNPVGGAVQYNEVFKSTYVDMLVRMKLISEDELNKSSKEYLFSKHFYKSDTINLQQLVGYHYYNNGLGLIDEKEYTSSVNQLQKAYYLNSKPQVRQMLVLALALKVNDDFKVSDTTHVHDYFTYIRLSGEKDYDFLYGRYAMAGEDLVLRKNNISAFEGMSQAIFNELGDKEEELSRFKESYYLLLMTYHALKENAPLMLYYTLLGYCTNPNNLRIAAVYDKMGKYGLEEVMLSGGPESDTMMILLDQLPAKCSHLNMKSVRNKYAFVQAAAAYEEGYNTIGDSLLNIAEANFAPDTANHNFTGDRMISGVYINISTSYYRKQDFKMAKAVLQRGLRLLPNDKDMKSQLKDINELRPSDFGNKYDPSKRPPPPPPPSYSGKPVPTPVKAPKQ